MIPRSASAASGTSSGGTRYSRSGAHVERAAAGREHAGPRDGVEQRRDRREGLLEVLEVVQHEQPGLRPEPLGDRLDRPLVLALLDPERRCDRREHALRVGHRREVDERRTAERRPPRPRAQASSCRCRRGR